MQSRKERATKAISNALQNIATSIADKLFLPMEVDYKNYFSKPIKALILVFFVYSIVIALPPVVEIVSENNFPLPLMSSILSEPDYWATWLPFINFVLEILFFLMIGGSVFSEWIASNSKKIFEDYQAAVEDAKEEDVSRIKAKLSKELKSYYLLVEGVNIRNFFPKLFALYRASNRIVNMIVKDVPRVNASFLSSKIAMSFPGGYYGLFAFVVFGALVQVKIGHFYLAGID